MADVRNLVREALECYSYVSSYRVHVLHAYTHRSTHELEFIYCLFFICFVLFSLIRFNLVNIPGHV